MVSSICAQNNPSYDSNDLASSDVFVKLSQHTSVEMSDFTVFVLVFLSYYLHLQSLKYHVSEMILGSQSIVKDSLAAQSTSNVATKLQQSETFDISLSKLYKTLVSDENSKSGLGGTTLFENIPTFKLAIPFLIALMIFIVFLSLTAPVWPSQLGGENLVIIGIIAGLASLALSYFVLTVETPALLWIILVSTAFAMYAVVKTSTCDPNKVCLYKPEGYGDNFLDFNYLWISLAVATFAVQKFLFSILLFRLKPFKILRGVSFLFFLIFYVFMIVTTLQSSPETKHHQYTPCTSKGSFVGQLIYWPLFLIIVFYIERGSYTFVDKVDMRTFGAAILTYIISTLLFLVPILTIAGWEGNRDTAISRKTCSLRQPTISLDTPDSRCCKTQKISSSSLRTFDVHFNHQQDVEGSNVSMRFELVRLENDVEVESRRIVETDNPIGAYALQIVRGPGKIPNGESLGASQIAMKAGTLAFDGQETEANYILRITFQDQSYLSFYQRFSSINHDQHFKFLRTDAPPTTMPDGSAMPKEEDAVGCTGRNAPEGINLRANLEKNQLTPGSEINPIEFTGRHSNTGPGMGAWWGFVVGSSIAGAYLGLTNATKENPDKSKEYFGVAGLLTGLLSGAVYGGVVGAPSGAISGAIVEWRLQGMKAKTTRFEYLDANNRRVARVEADDAAVEADSTLEKVPLNDTHTDAIWTQCRKSNQGATSSVANEYECEESQTPPITYTPPGHCKYLADFNIDFSKYPDTTKKTSIAHRLKFNANTGLEKKVYIHFKQKTADDPIGGPEWYIYWFIFFIFLIVFTFFIQVVLLVYEKQEILTIGLQKATKVVYKRTSVIAETAERLGGKASKGLESAATREIGQLDQPTVASRLMSLGASSKKGAAKVAKTIIDADYGKKRMGAAVVRLGEKARGGGQKLYEGSVKGFVNFSKGTTLRTKVKNGISNLLTGSEGGKLK